LGDKFPQAPLPLNRLHRGLDRSSGGGSLDGRALGALHVGERTEQELIAAIVNKITELKPQLATLDGSSFDRPVLRYRTMVIAPCSWTPEESQIESCEHQDNQNRFLKSIKSTPTVTAAITIT
jgi:hypothetical protein